MHFEKNASIICTSMYFYNTCSQIVCNTVSYVQYGVFIQVLHAYSDAAMMCYFVIAEILLLFLLKNPESMKRKNVTFFYIPLLLLRCHSIFHYGPDK